MGFEEFVMKKISGGRKGERKPFAFLTKTLSHSAAFLFGFISLVTIACATGDFFLMLEENAAATAKQAQDTKNNDLLVELTGLQKEIEIDVIQVQQFLTDYSATRALDGHDDGLGEAAKFAGKLPHDIEAAQKAAEAFGAPSLIEALAQVERQFPEYYGRGVEMAKVYAAEGPEGGNKLMETFDKISDEMQEHVEAAGKALEVAKQTLAKKAALRQQQIDNLRKSQTIMAAGSIALTGLTCLVGFFIVRKWLVMPLSSFVNSMLLLADGRNDLSIPGSRRTDEIGQMAATLRTFQRAAIDKQRLELEGEKNRHSLSEAQAQMEREKEEAAAHRTESLMKLIGTVENEGKSMGSVVGTLMQELTDICSTMSGATERLSSNTESAASIAQEAMGSMHSAKSATDELSKSFDEVVRHVNSAGTATSKAVAASDETGQKIDALNQSVAEISGITALIKDIARMTNLLAINAGVEAARAGSFGLGFDVIAKEVKSLSAQTSEATNRIANLIKKVQESTSEAVASVAGVSSIIRTVNDVSVKMSDAIKLQVQSARRIAANVTETAAAVALVTTRIEEVAAEASGVGQQATEVDQVCVNVADKVHGLQESLVRTLRSNSETDRRSFQRHEIRCEGELEFYGKTQPVEVWDISTGGAKLKGLFSEKASRGVLKLKGSSLRLSGQILSPAREEAHIQFSLSQEMLNLLTGELKQRVEKRNSFGVAA